MNKRDAERKIREVLEQLEAETGCLVGDIDIIKIEHGGLMGPNVDYCLDVDITLNRPPSTNWMKD